MPSNSIPTDLSSYGERTIVSFPFRGPMPWCGLHVLPQD